MEKRRWSRLFMPPIAALIATCGLVWPAVSFATTYSGRGEAVSVQLKVLSIPLAVNLVDTGQLDSTGGFKEATPLLTIGQPTLLPQLLLNAAVADATTSGLGTEATSWASVAAVNLGLGPVTPTALTVSADVLQATSKADCNGDGSVALSGSSIIANLVINGSVIPITGMPNQTITLPGLATIIINEQIKTANSITVNALHIKLIPPGSLLAPILSGDVIIAHADSDLSQCTCDPTKAVCPVCDPTKQSCPCDPTKESCPINCAVKEYMTGSGHVTKNGHKVTFNTVGGVNKDGTHFGHMSLEDSADGQNVVGDSVTAYSDPSPPSNGRKLTYHCDVGNGSCNVNEDDNGGSCSDNFEFDDSNFSAGSTSTPIDDGRIQRHEDEGCPDDDDTNPPPPHCGVGGSSSGSGSSSSGSSSSSSSGGHSSSSSSSSGGHSSSSSSSGGHSSSGSSSGGEDS